MVHYAPLSVILCTKFDHNDFERGPLTFPLDAKDVINTRLFCDTYVTLFNFWNLTVPPF